MNPAATLTTTNAPAKPRRRWWLRGVLALAFLGVALGGVYLVLTEMARRDWDAAIAETDALDPRWHMHEIENDQPAIPDAENSALFIDGIVSKVPRGRGVFSMPNYEKIFERFPPNVQLNEQQIQTIRTGLAPIAKEVGELRKLKDMLRGRFPMDFSNGNVEVLWPYMENRRAWWDWIPHDAMLNAQLGNIDRGVESCRCMVNAARSLADERFSNAYHQRVLGQLRAALTLERVLAQGEASDNCLHRLQALLALEMSESNVLGPLRGERAGYHRLYHQIRDGKVPAETLRSFLNGKPASVSERIAYTFPSTMMKYYPDQLRHMNRLVEIVKLPLHEQRIKIAAWEQERLKSADPVLRWMKGLANLVNHECRSQATLRTAVVAVACERYRLQHPQRRWPQSLDSLVEENLLDAVPIDPIDGRPLRYRRHKDFIVIYSIGIDETDNGGHIDDSVPYNAPGVDIGFRLWDVGARRQPPPVAIPEGN